MPEVLCLLSAKENVIFFEGISVGAEQHFSTMDRVILPCLVKKTFSDNIPYFVFPTSDEIRLAG